MSRADNTDRIQVAQLLTDAAAQGRLDLNEYESRLARAYSAKTYHELDRLASDLPGIATTPRGACRALPKSLVLGILSSFERRGRWNVPRKLTLIALWGNGVVDLRYADFTSSEVEIKAYSIMGIQSILAPPEINVVVEGTKLMGNIEDAASGSGASGAPVVTVRCFALWGGIHIKRKKRRPLAIPAD
ncbi:hypothetical protein MBRU_02570 [Mycolicibacterium brumae DSM 44177]|nr:hypothetical protein MBRU_02570 [Mycolicibacterium brumae DSM 44177]